MFKVQISEFQLSSLQSFQDLNGAQLSNKTKYIHLPAKFLNKMNTPEPPKEEFYVTTGHTSSPFIFKNQT